MRVYEDGLLFGTRHRADTSRCLSAVAGTARGGTAQSCVSGFLVKR